MLSGRAAARTHLPTPVGLANSAKVRARPRGPAARALVPRRPAVPPARAAERDQSSGEAGPRGEPTPPGAAAGRTPAQPSPRTATVALVGTGPGDPELLTLRALRALRGADVVLHDRLISREVLSLVSPGARLLDVGKACGRRGPTQEGINEALVRVAEEAGPGALVVRLKGGDPFVFGRGGEEALACRAAGLEVFVIPGITAAAGIAAELGIPLTHRGLATGTRYVTGHVKSGRAGEAEALDAPLASAAADPAATLVIYMGLGALPAIAAALEAAGARPDTPAAAISRGTTSRQRTVYAPLTDLPREVADAALESPTLVIVGPVVSVSPGWERARALGVPLAEGRGSCWAGRAVPDPCVPDDAFGLTPGDALGPPPAAVGVPRQALAAAGPAA